MIKSPFPGMDPYLEQHWRDVHHRLCTYSCDALQPQIRPALFARVDERLVVENDVGYERNVYPDVKIAVDPRAAADRRHDADLLVATLDEPLIVTVPSERPTEGFIKVIDPRAGGRLVTVIEFLSPANKTPGTGRDDYRQKQRELAASGVSLVEVDLIRAGTWTVATPMHYLAKKWLTPYRVCVHRSGSGDQYEFYPIAFNQRLPSIRVPLRKKDQDARLDLQAVINLVYTNGAYDTLDYSKPLNPPLDPKARAWSHSLLRGAGRLGKSRRKLS